MTDRLPEQRIIARYTVRSNGMTAGSKDWCFIDRKTNKRYRSRIQVRRVLEEEEKQTNPVSDTAPKSEEMEVADREPRPNSLTQMLSGPNCSKGLGKDFDQLLVKGTRMNRKRQENKRRREEELPVGFV